VVRENITTGKLVKVDDPRFDPMWEAAAAHKMPVAIHTSDPEAFFLPVNRFQRALRRAERASRLVVLRQGFSHRPRVAGGRLRVIQRHPNTQFIVLHVGDAENLAYISQAMDKYPNMSVDFAARISELGRQPRNARKFFDKYQDRILFGTDAVPKASNFRSRSSATICTRSTSVFSRPTMSISTTRRPRFLRRAAGRSPVWRCPTPRCARSIKTTRFGCWGL